MKKISLISSLIYMQVKPGFGDYGRIGIDVLNLDQCFLSCKGGRGQIKKEIGEGNIITVGASRH